MKTIICTGDSHTWGQGASGLFDSFIPEAQNGELRMPRFTFSSYVNLLRNKINVITSSKCHEYEAHLSDQLCLDNCRITNNIEMKKDSSIGFNDNCKLIRFCVIGVSGKSKLNILIDGILNKEIEINITSGYKMIVIQCNADGNHTVEAKCSSGEINIYRIETYSGNWAVINSGIGSCTAHDFLDKYYKDYVEDFYPSIIVIEAHTINDWIQNTPIKEYKQDVEALIEKARSIGSIPLLLSVSPIMGNQKNVSGVDFDYYVKAVEQSAMDSGVEFIDAHMELSKKMNANIFDNDWHVNNLGHEVYFKCIIDTLLKRELL